MNLIALQFRTETKREGGGYFLFAMKFLCMKVPPVNSHQKSHGISWKCHGHFLLLRGDAQLYRDYYHSWAK